MFVKTFISAFIGGPHRGRRNTSIAASRHRSVQSIFVLLLSFGLAVFGVRNSAGAPSPFSPTGSLATARSNHTATLLPSGKVLVVGGYTEPHGPPPVALSSAELYDPATGSWSPTGSLATARYDHTATLLPNGKVLVAGGYNNAALASAELYDPATGSWSPTGALGTARSEHTATLLPNGKVLVAAGYSNSLFGNYQNSAELYDPAIGTWSTTGSLAIVRANHTATLLPGGKVLVAGGDTNPSAPRSELYDPGTAGWSNTGSLAILRANHTATLLPNGQVLVAGGYKGGAISSAELYDPATGNWAATFGSMNQSRGWHTATLLLNGKVLIAGGIATTGSNDATTASCELYDPSAPGPTPTPTATPTASATPTPTPTPARSLNISARARVQTGNNAMIGGFIVTGNVAKKVIIRALGPSTMKFGFTGTLADPVLELRGPDGSLILANDNWKDNPDQALLIQASGLPPQDDLESAIVATLPPAGYTAIVTGKSGGTGIGLVEVYDLEQNTSSKLANLSTRAFVETGDNVLFAGFILGGASGSPRIFVRALGPSLGGLGIANPLADPTLELRDQNGGLIAFDDNWKDNPAQATQITAAGLQPRDDLEAVIAIAPPPGIYTAIVTGRNAGTGVGIVEVYNLQ